ncbi:MAG: S8 family serine peptidase [Nitrosopumilus sp.]|nr:S8 family serine peptidase [Nitrosopumilus sp.]MDH3490099.1 S8 family serine peptidase [Nitrosopumilus sp.]MDH3517274.1 S8 family serine peptidase [Nitrosopumilus sp.]MDH3565128.1 S8 family serine peptidase [Nitrosopumilus sp.]MDH5555325.1 S8 family serine peptidase [Nitrosopumilus sp.]
MPKVAIFFFIILLSSTVANSHAFISGDLTSLNKIQNPIIFDSGIVEVDSNFFTQNDVKRYLIFGNNLQNNDFLKTNSIYGIQSDYGFFYVSVLSENSASHLAAQGYHIIEDSKLDFHLSDDEIVDVSRIGDITGSNMAKKKYNASGNGTIIAIVDTGVDFSNPDIQHSVARDKINHPVMLDPDGQGIILTNATFFAYIDKNEIIRNYTKPIPSHMTSSVYVTRDGVFLDVSQGGKGSEIPIYNSFFPQIGNSVIFNGTLDKDMKIGNNNKDYIKSKSGIYHLGVIYQGALEGPMTRLQVVPVLVIDSFIPGVYDTIIPDMSTSWEDYTRFDLKSGQKPNYDFDFTDEKPLVLGSGKEFLVYDSNNDGKNDYSAGTFGAQVLDVYGAIRNNSTDIDDTLNAINGTLLPAFDSDGEFFGLMTDFMGHGTSSAASITSRGQETYDIYNNSKKYTITGVAPDAKIVPVKALWLGDTVYGWLWSAGFENKDHTWKFSGNPKVDIISNSWGVSNFPSFNSSPGMDVLSIILSMLTTPYSLDENYPGVTIVSSAGNSGHGYGTIGLPNASPFGISVGATTNNVFVGYGPFKDQPRFGNTTTHSNDVVDFSSRGPGSIGDPKPDVMSIGAHGFVPSNVLKTQKDSKAESFSLFGGTSMAAPLVSGSTAILIEELKKQSQDYDPFLIKNILMSTAKDLSSDPFTQGSGLANIESALNYVHGEDGVFIVYNDDSYNNIKKILDPSIEHINSTTIGFERFQLPTRSFPMTSWFAGQLLPGERTTTTFTIKNPTNSTLQINVMPQTLSLISNNQFNGTTILRQHDSILNGTDKFIPNYIELSDVNTRTELSDFFSEGKSIPDESSLMILNLNFQFSDFMNNTSDVYADDLKISSLYLYDWIDNNNDTKISSNELSMVNRAGSWGTVQELRVSEPTEKFEGVPLVGVYPIPTRYSYWLGDTKQNSTSMDYTISASYYEKEQWSVVWSESKIISIPPKNIATIDVTLIVPNNYQTGIYQGFLNFKSDNHTVNAPISFVVKQPVIQNDSTILIKGVQSNDILYGNGYTKGAFDMANRYMAGDWRQYYFDVQNESINSAAIELSWTSDDTNLSVFVMDPTGKIIQTNVPSGVFGHFLDWTSLDWLGNSIFSQGGGFFPVKNKDDVSTVLYVPINQTGTYTLLTHSTLFGGDSITEPITLAAKFTNISPEMIFDIPVDKETEYTPSDIVENIAIINETKIPPSPPVEAITYSDSSFSDGIVVGVVIGTAIGIAFIFIIRQKPPK